MQPVRPGDDLREPAAQSRQLKGPSYGDSGLFVHTRGRYPARAPVSESGPRGPPGVTPAATGRRRAAPSPRAIQDAGTLSFSQLVLPGTPSASLPLKPSFCCQA